MGGTADRTVMVVYVNTLILVLEHIVCEYFETILLIYAHMCVCVYILLLLF